MFMLGLIETIDQLVIANSVRWYGHLLRGEDGHFLRRALDFEVEGQRRKGRPKRTWKRLVSMALCSKKAFFVSQILMIKWLQ